ncbi:DUF6762 family protein [Tepidibacter hydrothermalis]|uniref:Uncharacterized protein n=1 Tax=Tepidibacter hydrothermalis TaxID=3036126 RepID=A0ABY8E8W3_9FIRM|nr:DUF6762 family protein [Tepidibacter hydrothermalis]WFD09351.1 hypothetical protein P4S50_13255 [Tepidibacter hydrothermalis]
MESFALILMQKNKETLEIEKEIGSYTIGSNLDLINGIYMTCEDEKNIVHLKLTTEKDVEDWEFSAILDYYDDEVLNELILSVKEIEDAYNPTWEVDFEFVDSQDGMQSKIESILDKHKKELDEVYAEIKDKEEEYK